MIRRAKFDKASDALNARNILRKQGNEVVSVYDSYLGYFILRWFPA